MSGKKNNTVKKKKPDKQKLTARIICIILAGLMVGSGVVTLILTLTSDSFAKDHGFDVSQKVFVGIAYGDSSLVSATFQSTDGFSVGTVDGSGSFTETAETSASAITATVSSSSVILTDTNGNRISGSSDSVAVKPKSGSFYISPLGNTYEGVIRCTVSGDRLEAVNIVPVETYIAGVIPNEIDPDWNLQTVCAFAVTVRSYALGMLGRHSHDGFDLCASTHCQVYRGTRNINDNVRTAVKMTEGIVMTYNGGIVQAFYSDCTGGCSVDASDVWGGSYGYLKAKATPWEKYRDYKYGTWELEYSGQQLYEMLEKKGYTGLDSPVVSVEADSTAANSTYVTSLTFTDMNGNRQTVTRCDRIRALLSSRSANFTVGKAGGSALEKEFVPVSGTAGAHVITADGRAVTDSESTLNVVTRNGKETVNGGRIYVLTSYGKYDTELDSAYPTEWERLVYSEKIAEDRIVTLGGQSGNFVFRGRGNGHGVGMSQLGAKDLGDMGADYQTILKAYFTDIAIEKLY